MSFKPRRSVTSEGHLVKACLSNLSSQSTPLFMGVILESCTISVLAEGGNLSQGKTGGVIGSYFHFIAYLLCFDVSNFPNVFHDVSGDLNSYTLQ